MGIAIRLGRLLSACALLIMLISVASAALPDTIFTRPPPPEKLAALLFGTKYRSAQRVGTEVPGRFGMMIHFEYDSVKIVPKSLPLLDSVGEMLQLDHVRTEVLVIEGHADASGPEAYNQGLSQRRADAIKRYLEAAFDIPAKRLVTVGAGETTPHNRDDPYHAINRRVLFRTAHSIVID